MTDQVAPPPRAPAHRIFGTHDDNTLAQFYDVASRAVAAALMADGHVGFVMPVGGVAAYREHVSVVGVGVDIACGNAAIRTDLKGSDLGDVRARGVLAEEIRRMISFGLSRPVNKADDAPVDDPLFDDPAWGALPAEANAEVLKARARSQLGTVGSGNHYVDVFADEGDRVWVGVHFGSRGFGHTVAKGFEALSQGEVWGKRVPEREVLLDLSTPLGDGYWALMELAGRYAYAGREWVARKVVGLLGGQEEFLVHNNHNFAWKERHREGQLVVVRKGATPAWPGQMGFIGGSMGDDAVIVRGLDWPEGTGPRERQRAALFSTVHGAGRVMSRTQAAGKRDKRGRHRGGGAISYTDMRAWIDEKGVVLRGGGCDEAPQAYRRLHEVIQAHAGTIQVVSILTPLIVVMAESGEHDPYKD